MGSKEELLRIDTHDEAVNAFNCVINAVSGLADEIAALRTDLASYASELRSIREHIHTQDAEIWTRDGMSRLSALQNDTQRQALQIKGIWSVLGTLLMFITAWALAHLK